MLISVIRTVILYAALILTIRLMGKRQLGQMEPAEFVVSMLIANLAAVPMQETGIPLLSGLVPILLVLAMELTLSAATYCSVGLRRLLCGKPVLLIEEGRILQENLRKTRVNPDELTEYLRIQGIVDLSTVQYAILETGGAISTMLYPKYAPASAKDAGIRAKEQPLPVTVISDGKLLTQNLKVLGKDRLWVEQQLHAHGCTVRDVFLFTAEPGGKIYLALRQEGTK